MASKLEITIGPPKAPPPESIADTIADTIRARPEIYFAFMPEIFIPGQMESPAEVLILVSDMDGASLERVTREIHEEIRELLPEVDSIDILAVPPEHELVIPSIATTCLIEINDNEVFELCQKSNTEFEI